MFIKYVKAKPDLYRGWRGLDVIVESDADEKTIANSVADFLKTVLHCTRAGYLSDLDTENMWNYHVVFGGDDEFTLKDMKDAVSILDEDKDKLKI